VKRALLQAALLVTAVWDVGGCAVREEVLGDRGIAAVDAGPGPIADVSVDAPSGTGAWIATGQGHTCAIRTGQLACWGENGGGRLGVGDEIDRERPSFVAGGPWVQVSAGDAHTCARGDGGDVWCFGDNAVGQIGVGDRTPRRAPARVSLARAATTISAGFDVSCALLDDGTLWCWGENLEGQLGQGDSYPGEPSDTPRRVGTDADWTRISAGQGHVCGIRAPGTLWCWGRNTDGQLGLGDGTPGQIRTPTRVGAQSDWVDVDVGQQTSCGLRANGSMWCWGTNGFGQVGTAPSPDVTTPRRVGFDTDWREVRTDTFATCARRVDGSLWCFGRNVEGQLGLGDTADRSTPTRVGSATDWVQVDVGRFHACARKVDGSIHCTGANANGQLGLGDRDRRNTFQPAVLAAPPG
jgi:alpha-tubulin suppressor-like RCC1 family protein